MVLSTAAPPHRRTTAAVQASPPAGTLSSNPTANSTVRVGSSPHAHARVVLPAFPVRQPAGGIDQLLDQTSTWASEEASAEGGCDSDAFDREFRYVSGGARCCTAVANDAGMRPGWPVTAFGASHCAAYHDHPVQVYISHVLVDTRRRHSRLLQ